MSINYKQYGIIYGLVDPNTNNIRYVGKSLTGIDRAYHHYTPSSIKEGNTPKNNWIKRLRNNNQKYKVVILFAIEHNKYNKNDLNDILYSKEQELISSTENLLNLCDGGCGAPNRLVSKETRKKMSVSAKKRDFSYLVKYSIRSDKEKLETKLRNKEKLKARDRKVPGSRFNDSKNRGKKVIAISENGIQIGFFASRIAASFIGGKCSHTGIRFAIENKTKYYGFHWEYI